MLDVKVLCGEASPITRLFRDKQVVIEIFEVSGETIHKLGPVQFISCEPQKLTVMKNAPEKRVNSQGKSYTPPMMKLCFEHDASLVFVAEDTKLAAVYNGFRFVLDNYYVSVVLYEHE
jgi:hypothetical protein